MKHRGKWTALLLAAALTVFFIVFGESIYYGLFPAARIWGEWEVIESIEKDSAECQIVISFGSDAVRRTNVYIEGELVETVESRYRVDGDRIYHVDDEGRIRPPEERFTLSEEGLLTIENTVGNRSLLERVARRR